MRNNPIKMWETYVGLALYVLALFIAGYTSKTLLLILAFPVTLAIKLFPCTGGLECIGEAIMIAAITVLLTGLTLGYLWGRYRR